MAKRQFLGPVAAILAALVTPVAASPNPPSLTQLRQETDVAKSPSIPATIATVAPLEDFVLERNSADIQFARHGSHRSHSSHSSHRSHVSSR